MIGLSPWEALLACHREVHVDGKRVFDLFFSERAGFSHRPDPANGVIDLNTVTQFEHALRDCYRRLTSSQFGWSGWTDSSNSKNTRDVAVLDLGPNYHGAAIAGTSEVPYLTLSCRVHEPTPAGSRRRRYATVAHELVHLLQFETDTFRYWPERGCWGEGDPNWWLHEATALASEATLYPETPGCWPLLWDWATRPEVSIEADASGILATPLILFLMHKVGLHFAASVYANTKDNVPSMRGVDFLAAASQQHAVRFARVDGDDVFADYCVNAGLAGHTATVLPATLPEVVGPRALTDVIDRYPFSGAGKNCPIDHLACRYFLFRIPEGTSRLEVKLTPNEPSGFDVLRGELVQVSDDPQAERWTMTRSERGAPLKGAMHGFGRNSPDLVMLVVINCGFGEGWIKYDGLTFSISGQVE